MTAIFDEHKVFAGKYQLFRDTWLNGGFNVPNQIHVSYKDLMSTSQAAVWLPKLITDITLEPVEPMLIIPGLLDRIAYTSSVRITMPALGSIVAADVGENMAYPERTLNIAPGSQVVNVGKSGVMFRITEEMQTYSQYDLMTMHIRAGQRALERHKEAKGMRMISGMGVTLFDNIFPTTSMYGTCTGRSMTGAGNGSCRMEDLLKGYSHIMMQGYTPNTILLHPMAWSMWMIDPFLQTIAKMTGNGGYFQKVNMAKSARPWANASLGGQGTTSGYGQFTASSNAGSETPTSVAELDQNLNSPAVIPNYFPYPLRVLVSPFVPWNEDNQTCDIMIMDSANVGAIVVESDVSLDKWDDMQYDVTRVKLKEKYTFATYDDGLAIGVFRNVPIKANEISLPVQPGISVAGSLDDLDVTTAIAGL
jgi:hypothetical protein